MSQDKTVFVGLSGGVDSSVTAYLLKQAKPNNYKKLFGRPAPKGFRGYKVVGAFIKTWQPDFIDCTWKDERRDAMRVAAHLEIPFVTIDLEKEYKEGVADYMISEYKAGRTPNPDVMCNKEIKFGGFLKKAMEMGADYVATGHYAQKGEFSISNNQFSIKDPKYQLLKAKDTAKEQSYFLWTLAQDQLSKILFPIGHLQKSEVRNIAKKAGLLTAGKKDSQGLCFIGKIDFKDFLRHYIEPKQGDVLNEKGEVIGEHDGVTFLTLGERSGFTIIKKGINDKPLYVISKDIKKNTITVAPDPSSTPNPQSIIPLISTNWIPSLRVEGKHYNAQIRYHGELLKCQIEITGPDTAAIKFEKPQLVASGQSIVVYDGNVCVGGGIVN